MLLHRHENQNLLWHRPPSGIWGGLWSLPEVDNRKAIKLWQQSFLSMSQAPKTIQDKIIRHQFTHYSLDISIAMIELERFPDKISDGNNYRWVDVDELAQYGLPIPVTY